jgi:hypothetical protein
VSQNATREPQAVRTIYLPSRPQVDTVLAVFLLRKFGEAAFPGVGEADVQMHSQQTVAGEGALMLDCGGGEFDHHNAQPPVTASALVARALGVEGRGAIKKILDLAYRDDVHGKGIMSTDAIDRAFGLPGLISSAARSYPSDPRKIIEIFMPVLEAHYIEEEKRAEGMPREMERLAKEGKVETFDVRQRGQSLRVIVLECDDPSMSGYLRSQNGGRHDVVAQWRTSGHLNITTRTVQHRPRVDLAPLAAALRKGEIMLSGGTIEADDEMLMKPGRIPGLENWYYDTATNSILNGGAHYAETPATKIPRAKLRGLIELAFRA